MIGLKLKGLAVGGLCALALASVPGKANAWVANGDCSSQYFVGRYSLDPATLPYFSAFRTVAYQYGTGEAVWTEWRTFPAYNRVSALEYLPMPLGTGWWAEQIQAWGWNGSEWFSLGNYWLPVNGGVAGYYCYF